MKNNEIMISAKFESSELSDEISFLVIKDISLQVLIEALYYGLKKSEKYEKHFELLDHYLKTHKELQVVYNAKGDFNVIDFTECFVLLLICPLINNLKFSVARLNKLEITPDMVLQM